jgi:hypothetical protein
VPEEDSATHPRRKVTVRDSRTEKKYETNCSHEHCSINFGRERREGLLRVTQPHTVQIARSAIKTGSDAKTSEEPRGVLGTYWPRVGGRVSDTDATGFLTAYIVLHLSGIPTLKSFGCNGSYCLLM